MKSEIDVALKELMVIWAAFLCSISSFLKCDFSHYFSLWIISRRQTISHFRYYDFFKYWTYYKQISTLIDPAWYDSSPRQSGMLELTNSIYSPQVTLLSISTSNIFPTYAFLTILLSPKSNSRPHVSLLHKMKQTHWYFLDVNLEI